MKKICSAFNAYVRKKEPLSLVHFITERCSSRCKHCFIDSEKVCPQEKELSVGEIEKLSSSVGGSLMNINITGGEPFIREDIFEIVHAYIKNAKVGSVYITTNGFYRARIKDFIEKVINKKIEEQIVFSVSIDNLEDKHDENRGKGSFQKALSSLKLINSYGRKNISTNVAITITEYNYKDIEKVYDFLVSRGVAAITATLMREQGRVKKIDYEKKEKILRGYEKITRKINADLLKGKLKGFGSAGFLGRVINSKNIILDKILAQMYMGGRGFSPCYAGRLFGVISARGRVFSCEVLEGALGSLRDYDMSFIALWSGAKAKKTAKVIKEEKCSCAYGCAWTINIISNPRFIPLLIANMCRVQ